MHGFFACTVLGSCLLEFHAAHQTHSCLAHVCSVSRRIKLSAISGWSICLSCVASETPCCSGSQRTLTPELCPSVEHPGGHVGQCRIQRLTARRASTVLVTSLGAGRGLLAAWQTEVERKRTGTTYVVASAHILDTMCAQKGWAMIELIAPPWFCADDLLEPRNNVNTIPSEQRMSFARFLGNLFREFAETITTSGLR